MRSLKLLLLLALLAVPAAGQTVFPSNLTLDAAPADSDNLIVCKVGDTRCKRTTRGTLRSGLLGTTGSQSQGFFFAGPCSGGAGTPLWRAICAGDLPALQLGAAPFGSEGTTTKVLHGNASGLFTWSQIVGGDIASATIPDAAMGTSYSGIGTCSANTYATQLGRNAAPACSATPWSRTGTVTSLTNSGDTVGIGTASPPSKLTVSANAATPPTPVSGVLLQVSGADATAARAEVEGFGSGGLPGIVFRRSLGTATSRSALGVANTFGGLYWQGAYDATNFSGDVAQIGCETAEAFTSTTQGTNCFISTTHTGGTTLERRYIVDSSGHLVWGTTTTAPSVACTGTGTSPAAPTIAGVDAAFTITVNTGTGSPGSSGTCTVTFGTAFVTNMPVLVCTLQNGATAWGVGSGVMVSAKSLSAPVLTWWNESAGALTALATSTSYQISCRIDGKGN